MKFDATYVIIGGGIAGVTCAETLSHLSPDEKIILVSASPLVKAVKNVLKLTPNLESFDVQEVSPVHLNASLPNVTFINAVVTKLDGNNRIVLTSDGNEISFRKLCICSGASPNIVDENNHHVIGIRDTETVLQLQKKIQDAKRIVVLGNGGIATELIYEIESCEIFWVIKDSSIGLTFFDCGAAQFFIQQLEKSETSDSGLTKRLKYKLSSDAKQVCSHRVLGGALGPDWSSNTSLKGLSNRKLNIEYNCTIDSIITETRQSRESENSENWPIRVVLSSGKVIGCDFVISATGVIPNAKVFLEGNDFVVAEDGGIEVDDRMTTSVNDVYAAGDVCSASWEKGMHWMQMRLWTQARQMGHYAAKCMVADVNNDSSLQMDFCFELFTHATKFFGYKVILLGLYNGQGLSPDEIELLVRITKGKEYVKTVMKDGRMQGAVLIGETDLEETFENLILNQMDLSQYGQDLLDPNVDIEDYFD